MEKNIDAKKRNITLIYGGERISAEAIAQIGKRLGNYGLEKTDLIIKQGFESLSSNYKIEFTGSLCGQHSRLLLGNQPATDKKQVKLFG